jgi:hypothetical protein
MMLTDMDLQAPPGSRWRAYRIDPATGYPDIECFAPDEREAVYMFGICEWMMDAGPGDRAPLDAPKPRLIASHGHVARLPAPPSIDIEILPLADLMPPPAPTPPPKVSTWQKLLNLLGR